MGLKFKRFKAKLNWKTKETIPDVVCLRYQIHSEFEDSLQIPVPTTSSRQLGTNNVIKEKKAPTKPPIQGMFETNTSIPITTTPTTVIPKTPPSSDTNNVNNNNNISKSNGVLTTNQTTAASSTEPTTPPKGILKKSISDENVIVESNLKENDDKDTEDNKKSLLIFMTENHDDEEPIEEIHTTIKYNKTPDFKTVVSPQEVETSKFQYNEPQQHSNSHIEENIIIRQQSNKSDSDSEQADIKTVRWRETIMEINPPNLEIDPEKSNETEDDYKVHFVKHHNFSTTGLQAEQPETEESEPEDNDQPKVTSYYGNRGAYSSQAASIFFAGEEPEPIPRVRKVSKGQDADIDV